MWRGALVAGVGLAELSCPAGPGGEERGKGLSLCAAL